MNKRTSQPRTSPKITKALLDKLSDGILLIDNNDQIVFCNHAATTLTGKENIVGRHLTTLLKLPATNGRPQPHPVLFRLPNTSTDTLAIFFDIRTLSALQRLSKRAKCAL
jgi:PAS domain-containing protein